MRPATIGPVATALRPMLASSPRSESLTPGYWAFEPKLDGWRVIVTVDEGVTIHTRNGRDITRALPEMHGLSTALRERRAVLDGELVAGAGRPDDFYRILERVGSRPRPSLSPLTFAAFDVLDLDGKSLCDRAYTDRRRLLASLGLEGPSWTTVASFDAPVEDVFTACLVHDLEGIVAKRLDSTYRPGERSRAWLKLKTSTWREAHAPRRHDQVRDGR